ncbi:MAG: U32 family peptidase [Spirochaetales bacterium]|jgi:putative protease|nr:U32 family peptidase [Spirochaetales bacterium]
MELLAPAGNLEKLYYAYAYGADVAYIGIHNFSLRARAENFSADEWKDMEEIKGRKKLFGALNIYFHNDDIKRLNESLPYISQYPFEAFIVSDLGAAEVLKNRFPDTPLHLSTQANCINTSAAKAYWNMGFSRIVLGREVSLGEISAIKQAVPEMEIETFVHGAMCIAYSGRCFLSRYLSDRSANEGDCAHSCRWHYRLNNLDLALEEEKRPGEYFPVYEGDGFTSILSSKDLCMIDYLRDLRDAGVDSLKIEGRMKSIYYTAVTTRAYRKALDALKSGATEDSWHGYREELFKVSRREYSTGFYFGKNEIEASTDKSYMREYQFLGSIGQTLDSGLHELAVKNQIRTDDELEYVGPDIIYIADSSFELIDQDGILTDKIDHGKPAFIRTDKAVKPGYILRKKLPQNSTETDNQR